jgi:hypothetical protein
VAIALKARPYVLDTRYEKAFETDVHLRVLEAFRLHGIHPPALLHRDASQLRSLSGDGLRPTTAELTQ